MEPTNIWMQSDNTVHALALDGNGTLWVGTDWGLASYDGVNWVVYQEGNSGGNWCAVNHAAVSRGGGWWHQSLCCWHRPRMFALKGHGQVIHKFFPLIKASNTT